MKRAFLKVTMAIMMITIFACTSIISAAVAVTPADFDLLDDFESYASNQAAVDAGYAPYAYGNLSTTIEIVSADTHSGKGLKVSNAAAAERLDFAKTYTLSAGADGISFWFNNTSGIDLSVSPLINYNSVVLEQNYFVKADGTSTYVETTPAGSTYFPIVIPAGFKGEIAIPFTSFQTTYPSAEATVFIMQVWGVTTLYSVVVDDIKFYGVDVPDVVESTVSSSTTSSPTTSDSSQTLLFGLVSLLALACISFVTIKRRLNSTN